MRPLSLAVAVVASIAASVPAQAQIGLNPVQDYINKTTLLNNILSNMRAQEMIQRSQTGGKTPGSASGSTRGSASASATQFTPTGQTILPKLLAQRTGGDAAQQQQAQRFFESMLELYRQTAAHDGFPANDLAYAMEYFVVNGYMTYHDLHDVPYEKDPRAKRGKDSFERLQMLAEKKALKPSLSDERTVYSQIQANLAKNPSVQQMSDQDKQQLTELLAIMLGVNYTAYMKGVNSEDDALMNQARQSARQTLEKLVGAPIERIKIDANGLSQ